MNDESVYTFASWRVKKNRLDAVLELLAKVAAASTAEEGNLFYQVHQNGADANLLMLFEGYKNEAALAEHRNSEHFQTLVLGKIVPLLDEREIIVTRRLIPE